MVGGQTLQIYPKGGNLFRSMAYTVPWSLFSLENKELTVEGIIRAFEKLRFEAEGYKC